MLVAPLSSGDGTTERIKGLESEIQGHNLALTVLHAPYSTSGIPVQGHLLSICSCCNPCLVLSTDRASLPVRSPKIVRLFRNV